MAEAIITPNDQVNLRVSKANDQVVAYVNGQEVYNRAAPGGETLNDQLVVSELFRDGFNVVLILGARWGGGHEYDVEVLKNDAVIARKAWPANASNQDVGVVWDINLEFFRTNKKGN
jgi:hypothetical protein